MLTGSFCAELLAAIGGVEAVDKAELVYS